MELEPSLLSTSAHRATCTPRPPICAMNVTKCCVATDTGSTPVRGRQSASRSRSRPSRRRPSTGGVVSTTRGTAEWAVTSLPATSRADTRALYWVPGMRESPANEASSHVPEPLFCESATTIEGETISPACVVTRVTVYSAALVCKVWFTSECDANRRQRTRAELVLVCTVCGKPTPPPYEAGCGKPSLPRTATRAGADV
mmetsp:Transcript_14810/g.30882  ORF Transcript_14810/g.30882 Transcript_14810/m.30882 type:complete len:200 (-) Transcript_14810:1076-1675(-)